MIRRTGLTLVVLAVLIAACGGGEAGDGVASLPEDTANLADGVDEDNPTDSAVEAASEEVDSEAAMMAFTQCMRDQGIDVPDPVVGGDGNPRMQVGMGGEGGLDALDMEAVQRARDACAEHLEGVTQQFSQTDQTEMQDAMLEVAQCLRDQGFDVPDPDVTGISDGGATVGGSPWGDSVDPSSPAFQEAMDVCLEGVDIQMRRPGGSGG